MRLLRASVLTFSFLALAGCSMFESKVDYKSDAEKAAALEVPPDLTVPATEDHYTVPEGGKEAATSYSEYAKGAQAPACVCKEQAAAPAPAPVAPQLEAQPDGSKRIIIGETFDRCWLTVGQALDRAKLAVEDKDRANGQFFLKGGHNQVTVRQAGGACEVAANNGSGAANDETKRIIDQIFKSLAK